MKFNKKGITMVEAILTLAISSVVLLAISIAIQNFSEQYTNVQQRIDGKTVATVVYQTIELKARTARQASIYSSNDPYANIITSRNGRLYSSPEPKDATLLLEEETFSNLNCNVTFYKKDDATVRIEIIIYAGPVPTSPTVAPAQQVYKVTRDMRLLNTYDAARSFGASTDIVSVPGGAPAKSDQLRYLL